MEARHKAVTHETSGPGETVGGLIKACTGNICGLHWRITPEPTLRDLKPRASGDRHE